MARKKRVHSKKTHKRRRSRMGAIKSSVLMDLAYNVAGGIAAKYVSSAIKSALGTSVGDKTASAIAGAAPIAVGLFLPKKSAALKGLATGMQVVGAVNLVSGLTGMAGVGLVPGADYSAPFVGAIENASSDVRSMPMAMVAGSYC
jgi:hypothetical protein